MGGLSYLTAGESHGVGFSVIVSGFPAGLALDVDAVNRILAERQCGYGRGDRMALEHRWQLRTHLCVFVWDLFVFVSWFVFVCCLLSVC